MVREKCEISQIIDFAQQNLAKLQIDNDMLLEEMEQTLALAIFEEPHNSPFKMLLSDEHRHKTAQAINESLLGHKLINPQSQIKRLILTADSLQGILSDNKITYPKIENFSSGKYTTPN